MQTKKRVTVITALCWINSANPTFITSSRDPTADAVGIIVKQVKRGLEKDGLGRMWHVTSPKGHSRVQVINDKTLGRDPQAGTTLLQVPACRMWNTHTTSFKIREAGHPPSGRVFDIAGFRQKGIPTQIGNDQPEVCSFADIYGYCCLWCSFLVALIQPYVVNWAQSTSQLTDFQMLTIPRVFSPPPHPHPQVRCKLQLHLWCGIS